MSEIPKHHNLIGQEVRFFRNELKENELPIRGILCGLKGLVKSQEQKEPVNGIKDYWLVIEGATGATLKVSLVSHYVRPTQTAEKKMTQKQFKEWWYNE